MSPLIRSWRWIEIEMITFGNFCGDLARLVASFRRRNLGGFLPVFRRALVALRFELLTVYTLKNVFQCVFS